MLVFVTFLKEMKFLVIVLLFTLCNGQSTCKTKARSDLSFSFQTIQEELLLLRTELRKSKVGI